MGYAKLQKDFFYNNKKVSFKDIGTLGFCLYCYLVRSQRFDNGISVSVDVILEELYLQRRDKNDIINSLLDLEKYSLITIDQCNSVFDDKINIHAIIHISIIESENYIPMNSYDWDIYKYFTKNKSSYVLYWLIQVYYSKDYKYSFPSYELMCYVTGFSNSTIGKIIDEFRVMGIFHVYNKGWRDLELGVTQKKKYNNEYNINIPGIEKILDMSVIEYKALASELKKKDSSTIE